MKIYAVYNSTSVNISVGGLSPLLWRGSWKYFIITAEAPTENGTKSFIKNITFEYELEQYTNKSDVCKLRLIKKSLLQFCNTSMQIRLNNLHHFTRYSTTFKACNEKGCGQVSETIIFTTDEYIPTCSPI